MARARGIRERERQAANSRSTDRLAELIRYSRRAVRDHWYIAQLLAQRFFLLERGFAPEHHRGRVARGEMQQREDDYADDQEHGQRPGPRRGHQGEKGALVQRLHAERPGFLGLAPGVGPGDEPLSA